MTAAINATIMTAPFGISDLVEQIQDDRCGAVSTFLGVVRNHDAGEQVTAIEYSAHPQSEQILAELVAEIAQRDQVHAVVCWHRVGLLEVGDAALGVAVASEHRAEAFQAVSDLTEAVKARLPIWKKQVFTDGRTAWSGLP